MKIHFCDLCNESVPQNDLEKGLAFMRKGRVICAKCDELMGGGGSESVAHAASGTQVESASRTSIAPDSAAARTLTSGEAATLVERGQRSGAPAPYRVESGGGLVAGFLAAVALVLVAIVSVMLLDRIQSVDEGIEDQFAELRREVGAVESQLQGSLDEARGAALIGTQSLDAQLQAFKQAQEESGRSTSQRLDNFLGRVDELHGRISALATTERAVADHARSLAMIEANLASLQLDLAKLAQDLADRPVVVAMPAQPAEPEGPAWLMLLEDLASANSGVRWNAVEDLGHTADPDVVPHLIPVLDDEDTFVRMAAARVLGDLGSDLAVGPLIDTLSDPAPSVRDAAVASLRLLTGQNFRFEPLAKESERTKRIRAWRDWWEKQKTA